MSQSTAKANSEANAAPLALLDLKGPIVLVGCGNMGGALLTGWLAQGLSPARAIVSDPSPAPSVASQIDAHSVKRIDSPNALDGNTKASVLVMAVKPQVMEDVYRSALTLVGPNTVVLSVAAGRTIASFEGPAPDGTAVVRSIPNTPSAIGRGMTVCFANPATTPVQRAVCETLLSAIGEVGWVDSEDLIDAATAISGSGPAYVFHLAEALAAAARELGLTPELAAQMANATVSGAGELIRQSDLPPATLRENVTSPNGTTQAALEVLMADADGLAQLMLAATKAARDRSRELAQ